MNWAKYRGPVSSSRFEDGRVVGSNPATPTNIKVIYNQVDGLFC